MVSFFSFLPPSSSSFSPSPQALLVIVAVSLGVAAAVCVRCIRLADADSAGCGETGGAASWITEECSDALQIANCVLPPSLAPLFTPLARSSPSQVCRGHNSPLHGMMMPQLARPPLFTTQSYYFPMKISILSLVVVLSRRSHLSSRVHLRFRRTNANRRGPVHPRFIRRVHLSPLSFHFPPCLHTPSPFFPSLSVVDISETFTTRTRWRQHIAG